MPPEWPERPERLEPERPVLRQAPGQAPERLEPGLLLQGARDPG